MAEPLRGLRIPDPCAADWGAMRGDAKRRFCDHCSKHVHNLSAMTADEARGVLSQGSVCVRFRQDDDGLAPRWPPPAPPKPEGPTPEPGETVIPEVT